MEFVQRHPHHSPIHEAKLTDEQLRFCRIFGPLRLTHQAQRVAIMIIYRYSSQSSIAIVFCGLCGLSPIVQQTSGCLSIIEANCLDMEVNHNREVIQNTTFNQCEAYSGGGMSTQLSNENSILELFNLGFENCSAEFGGGLYALVGYDGQLSFPLSGIPPPDTNYSIIMTSNTKLYTNIQINSITLSTGNIIIQSDGYSPETDEDTYNKQSISTSSFSNSLFTISETGDLSLLGLHFDNLNPSSTNALISIRSSDNAQQPKITIIDCEFNQDSSSYSSSSSNSSSRVDVNGGAIFLSINNGGQVTISNSYFDQCESRYGGGIDAAIYTGGKMNIIRQCNFTQCKAGTGGGGIQCYISEINSLFILDDVKFDGCISEGPNYSESGGGLNIFMITQAKSIINKVLFINCEAQGGGGMNLQSYSKEISEISNLSFINCKSEDYGGGIFMRISSEAEMAVTDTLQFINCEGNSGGGWWNLLIYVLWHIQN
ncbi:MAG: hypothetical protein EZS28_036060 [Streblomastix strix]|uniref:Right handed beta helix domain-containing protein n=1 Tax=Streblomastix strix TaxID=222440 RepID=A0A5J4UE84_9EUKA|nr:MAG: hypothetical protein EZS28_036060 [Streblomastix strix]